MRCTHRQIPGYALPAHDPLEFSASIRDGLALADNDLMYQAIVTGIAGIAPELYDRVRDFHSGAWESNPRNAITLSTLDLR